MTTLTPARVDEQLVDVTPPASMLDKIWAVVRISLGWIFLWAFVDKTLALGFSTGRAEDGSIDFLGDAAWINGGSPTTGFLKFATKGPFAGFFDNLAGQAWVDWLFMLALFGIGLALILGVGMRIATIGGATLLTLMWLAGFIWPEHNPFMDDHLIYAMVLIGLGVAKAGDTWGLGTRWANMPVVRRFPILR